MEQMQDQIDQMGREKAELVRVIGEKDTLLEELEQTNSSEISKLQLALQQAQRKLQEQSEQIVTLSGADVILRDNERLKDENARLQKEIDRSEREADRAKEACKARLQKKDDDLRQKIQDAEKKEAQARSREQQADNLIRDREHLISDKVSAETDRISRQLAGQYSRLIDLLRKDFFRKEQAAERRQIITSIYALALAVIIACRSGPYMKALTDTVMQIRSGILFCWGAFYRFAGKAAGISRKIPVPFLSGIIHWAIFTIVIVIICFIILGLIIIVTRLIWRRFHHQLKLWQVVLWASGIMVVSAYLEDYIYMSCPLNILLCDLFLCVAACACSIEYNTLHIKRQGS